MNHFINKKSVSNTLALGLALELALDQPIRSLLPEVHSPGPASKIFPAKHAAAFDPAAVTEKGTQKPVSFFLKLN